MSTTRTSTAPSPRSGRSWPDDGRFLRAPLIAAIDIVARPTIYYRHGQEGRFIGSSGFSPRQIRLDESRRARSFFSHGAHPALPVVSSPAECPERHGRLFFKHLDIDIRESAVVLEPLQNIRGQCVLSLFPRHQLLRTSAPPGPSFQPGLSPHPKPRFGLQFRFFSMRCPYGYHLPNKLCIQEKYRKFTQNCR